MEYTNYDVTLNASGRIVIPAPLRQECGLKPGDTLKMRYVDGNLVISTPRMALRRIQERVRSYTKGESLVEEILKMRREDGSA